MIVDGEFTNDLIELKFKLDKKWASDLEANLMYKKAQKSITHKIQSKFETWRSTDLKKGELWKSN